MNNEENVEHKEILNEVLESPSNQIDSRNLFGMNRKFRRSLYSSVRQGTANQQEVERFRSLGKEAYPWMQFKDLINEMKKKGLKKG